MLFRLTTATLLCTIASAQPPQGGPGGRPGGMGPPGAVASASFTGGVVPTDMASGFTGPGNMRPGPRPSGMGTGDGSSAMFPDSSQPTDIPFGGVGQGGVRPGAVATEGNLQGVGTEGSSTQNMNQGGGTGPGGMGQFGGMAGGGIYATGIDNPRNNTQGTGTGQGRPNGGRPGGSNSGSNTSSKSTQCAVADGTACAQDGSSNELSGSLSYDADTGVHSGVVIFNQCPNSDPNGRGNDEVDYKIKATSDCQEMTFPVAGYNTTGPSAAPLRLRLGISMFGVNIYGPFEAGFREGLVCEGSCAGGVDVPACEAILDFQCGTDSVDKSILSDPCAGHASPYHYHADLSCEYDQNAPGHSAMIGLALDGRGIYGLNEANDVGEAVQPTDLDFCGGHYGVIEEGGSAVYHYHTQTTAPYVLGCFGPGVDTIEQCRALYPDTCGTDYLVIETESGRTCYDTDCPCFNADGTNTNYTETTCPV